MSCRTRARAAQQDQSVHPLADRSAGAAAGLRPGRAVLTTDRPNGRPLIEGFGFGNSSMVLSTLATLLTMTAGTMLLVWMGELITEFGIGNGVSIIIFGGIVAVCQALSVFSGPQSRATSLVSSLFVLIGLLTVVGIVLHQ